VFLEETSKIKYILYNIVIIGFSETVLFYFLGEKY